MPTGVHPAGHTVGFSIYDEGAPYFFYFFFGVTGELSTLRQLMKVPNEPGLNPNNGLENVSLSDQFMASNPRKGQAKCPGAKTTSHDGRAGHVMTHMCHPSKARRMASVTIQVPMQGICTPATRIALWPAKLPSQAMSSSRPRARWPVKTCEKRNKQAKPSVPRQSGHITMPSPTRLQRSIHRSMQHTTGIRINAGLSLPSPTACVAGTLGVGKAPQLLRGV